MDRPPARGHAGIVPDDVRVASPSPRLLMPMHAPAGGTPRVIGAVHVSLSPSGSPGVKAASPSDSLEIERAVVKAAARLASTALRMAALRVAQGEGGAGLLSFMRADVALDPDSQYAGVLYDLDDAEARRSLDRALAACLTISDAYRRTHAFCHDLAIGGDMDLLRRLDAIAATVPGALDEGCRAEAAKLIESDVLARSQYLVGLAERAREEAAGWHAEDPSADGAAPAP